MPRNGAGTYTPPANSWNPAVDNTVISTSDWNAVLNDLALAISGSLARDGQTDATARIPFDLGVASFAGSTAGVSYAAEGDPDTGVYFPAANQVAMVAGGVVVMSATTTGVTFPLAVTFAGGQTLNGNLVVNGNTTLGDSSADTLTVNATGTFEGDQTFNGSADFNDPVTFTDTVTVPDASFSNAKLANMATSTIKGRVTAGTGAPEDLTGAQATTILSTFTGDSGSGGVKGLVPAPASGDSADHKYLMANGLWANELKAWGIFSGTTGATIAARGMSCVRGGTGSYTITLSPAMPSTDYALFVMGSLAGSESYIPSIGTKTTSGFVVTTNFNNAGSPTPIDQDQLSVAIIAA